MHFRYVAAVGSFVIALPLSSVHSQSTAPEPAKWSFSLGVDPTNLDLRRSEQGVEARMVANLTRSWQSANSRFGRHISLMVGADAPYQVEPGPGWQCAGDCTMQLSRKYAGLTAGASYDLLRISRFTPYLTGGAGMYYSSSTRSPADGALTLSELVLYQNGGGFGERRLSFGANAGLGLRVRLGSSELFVEQAYHRFDVRGAGGAVFPLNIGFRF